MPLLSRVIRLRLDELGLKPEQLVARSEIARSTVYSYLDDKRTPHGNTFKKLARGLDWTPAELQARLDGVALVSPVADEQIARIVGLLPSIPKDRLDAIEQHVTLAVQPTLRQSNGRRDGASNGHRKTEGKMRPMHRVPHEFADQGWLSTVYRGAQRRVANLLRALERPNIAYSPLSLQPAG